MKFEAADVQHYYERNTDSFLRFGEGGAHGAIHRAVRVGPSTSELEAFHYVDSELLKLVERVGESDGVPRVMDLGCGVGSSLEYLLERSPCRVYGFSLSETQVRYAGERLARFGERAEIRVSDFCRDALPGEMDLAYGIESFVQASDPIAFFRQAAGALRTGGLLALCDDFLSESASEPEARNWVTEFRLGWRLSSLMNRADADQLAESAGLRLVEDLDWSRYLALDRIRDKMIHGFVAAGRWGARFRANSKLDGVSPWWGNYLGGNALRQCLKRGWVEYRFRIWERVG